MADGTTVPIGQIQVGDMVATCDPVTGETSAQPALDVIVGVGDKHLIGVTTSRAPTAPEELGQFGDALRTDSWTATANHPPIWIEGGGWTDAEDLEVGDRTVGAAGEIRTVTGLIDKGWLTGRTVYNLSVANTHTFIVGGVGGASLAHNASGCSVGANKRASDLWRDQVAARLTMVPGNSVRTEVYKRTPFGKRYIDVEVTRGGKTWGIETKVGRSRYTPSQRAKDYYLRRVHGYHVTVAGTRR